MAVRLGEGKESRQEFRGTEGIGDSWLWTAIDSETKLLVSFHVGKRTPERSFNVDYRAFKLDDPYTKQAIRQIDARPQQKLENHEFSIAIFWAYYNWCRPHSSLNGKTPAQVAGLADHRWSLEELIGLIP